MFKSTWTFDLGKQTVVRYMVKNIHERKTENHPSILEVVKISLQKQF